MLGRDRAAALKKLATVKGRRDAGLLLLDSVPLIHEALNAGLVGEVLYDAECAPQDLIAAARRRGVTVTEARAADLKRIADVATSPGAIATGPLPKPPNWKALAAAPRLLGVYLDGIADPANTGAIARSAAAFGAAVLVLSPGSADATSPKALRASAGALLRLPVHREVERGDWPIDRLRPLILRAVARGGVDPRTVPRPPASPMDADGGVSDPVHAATPILVWLGNETSGPGPAPANFQTVDVTIPIHGDVESLNVAAAAAILLSIFQ